MNGFSIRVPFPSNHESVRVRHEVLLICLFPAHILELGLNQPDSRCIYGRNDGGPNAWVCVPVLPLAGGVASAGGLPSLSLRFLLRGMGMVTQGAAGVQGDDCTVGYAGSVGAS